MTYHTVVAIPGLTEPAHLTAENPAYLCEQLITYLGNKRSLLDFIGQGLDLVKRRLGRTKLSCFDAFSGSGVVARYLKQHANLLFANDLEAYAEIMNRCYLTNASDFPEREWQAAITEFTAMIAQTGLQAGFISELYAPRDDGDIQAGERAFYTNRNARFLDTARQYIAGLAPRLQPYFLAPLLAEASVHANTAGVFKGFYKDSATGRGRFGGRQQDALLRIRGEIALRRPCLSRYECECRVLRGDANLVSRDLAEVDLAYLDPPYNQHPYGSNYFMLNLIASYRRPGPVSPVSGIPPDWNRSRYNQNRHAQAALADLISGLKARFVLISFNSEGFINMDQMMNILKPQGRVEMLETQYNTFRGSRNLGGRATHVREYLYLLEKK